MSDLSLEVTTSEISHINTNSQVELLHQLQEQLRSQQEFFSSQRDLYLQEQQQQQNLQSTRQTPTTEVQQNNHWSFTQGLIVGQLSVILIIIIFIKFFVFADSSTLPSKAILRDASGVIVKRDKNQTTKTPKNSYLNSKEVDDLVEDEKILNNKAKVSSILEKTYYDVNNHPSESLDWFNVLIAQTISHLRTEALLSDNIYHSLNDFLLQTDMPEFMDKINLTEIDVGDDFPIFSNCRIKQNEKNIGRLEAKIDVDLSDTLTLGIETRLLLNHPRPLTAILPVSLTVSIVRFSGCLTVSLVNTNDQEFMDSKTTTPKQIGSKNDDSNENNNGAGTALMFSFSPDYRLEFVVKSLIGSRAKLQDVPKISSLIENRLKTWFVERCVEPRFQVVRLPSLWPRTKNTREPSSNSKEGNINDENI
ncbi:MMM1 [Candida jiufengensis]|uniref:MMM1 n=1 Tax=Candida jiufengensis TaxID=497108 RepID=UPI0022242FDA|nr:MMM1 [Candida jiufengensis]KAI5955329.1 MMM1 [Candida jiufengensis]